MGSAIVEIGSRGSASQTNSSERLFQMAYHELRQLAAARLRCGKAGNSLQATALVHEAYLRLLKGAQGPDAKIWTSRAHFYSAVAEAMRRILVDSARRKCRQKRGGDRSRVSLCLVSSSLASTPFDVLDIADALAAFEAEHPEHATIVKLRYFVGMTIAECAEALGIATPTVERRWRYARAWLAQRLKEIA